MLKGMYSIFDDAAEYYERPFVARTDGEAARVFADVCKDGNHPIGAHPEHYHLVKIAEFDDSQGCVVPLENHRTVLSGLLAAAADDSQAKLIGDIEDA